MIKSIVFGAFVLLSSAWVILFLRTHKPFGLLGYYGLGCLWLVIALALLWFFYKQKPFSQSAIALQYALLFLIPLLSYFSLSPKNDREWNPEVAHSVAYEQAGDTITVHHVRNFHWRSETDYDIRWETRKYELSKLKGVDLIISTWGMDKIAHTLLSFHFEDGEQLALSIEIRKEAHESFSSIAGFFRQYELAIIASDEKDIIFTRTNIRDDESTYIYPLKLSQTKAAALFLEYLKWGQKLQNTPQWYHSLSTNCTTAIYQMANRIEPVPFDYRILLSGLVPEYLYEHQVIDNRYALATWKEWGYIQPKTQDYARWHDQSSAKFSQVIRQDFPQ